MSIIPRMNTSCYQTDSSTSHTLIPNVGNTFSRFNSGSKIIHWVKVNSQTSTLLQDCVTAYKETPLLEQIIFIREMVLNRTTRIISRGSRQFQLTTREFDLLDLLIQNRGDILSREFIYGNVWGSNSVVSNSNLNAYMRLLRKKIDALGDPSLIQTIRGIGYKAKY